MACTLGLGAISEGGTRPYGDYPCLAKVIYCIEQAIETFTCLLQPF